MASVLAYDRDEDVPPLSGLTLTAASAALSDDASDLAFRLTQSATPEATRPAGEPEVASETLSEEEPVDEPPAAAADDLLEQLNQLRSEAGLFGFERVSPLQAMAEAYCPSLAVYFEDQYDAEGGNWAEALVHNAGGSDLDRRALAAGFDGWTNELLAWTAEEIELSEVARAFWAAPTHTEVLTSPDPTLSGAAVCESEEGYLYVVVLGGASPGEGGGAGASHNPFIIP